MASPFQGKIFCIGANKTGTTSTGAALTALGYTVGNQATAEMLFDDWVAMRFERIIDYCQAADAFQDIPFSLDFTYRALDRAFPGAKFILTVRDNPEQWHESLTRFHTLLLGKGRLPTADDLREYEFPSKGWLWKVMKFAYGIDESTVYDRDILTAHYEAHNHAVRAYFRHRPEDLLVLNLRHEDAMEMLCRFLGVRHEADMRTPHLNRSDLVLS